MTKKKKKKKKKKKEEEEEEEDEEEEQEASEGNGTNTPSSCLVRIGACPENWPEIYRPATKRYRLIIQH